MTSGRNIDQIVVAEFGEEWAHYDQSELSESERSDIFDNYFAIFPWAQIPATAEGADIGCGSGRWATMVAPRVGLLHCIEPSEMAMAVAQRNLKGQSNCRFHNASTDDIPLADGSLDFAYSLGVLHHIPDTALAMENCVRKLKPGAPFLVYLYYAMDNRPAWFRLVWRLSDVIRRTVSSMPSPLKRATTTALAVLVYLPTSRLALLAEKLGLNVSSWPLSAYRHRTFYVLATDSLDRFGTRLEHRFTRAQIALMMKNAGLENIRFLEREPFWTAVGYKT